MSTEGQTYTFSHDTTSPTDHTVRVEAQDDPAGFDVAHCPVCGQGDGTGYLKAHGAGTRIQHPRRAYPCTTSTVLTPEGQAEQPAASSPASSPTSG